MVKEYAGQVSNILTAIICSYYFPDRFQFTAYIVVSLALLFVGIYIYENDKPINRRAREEAAMAEAAANAAKKQE